MSFTLVDNTTGLESIHTVVEGHEIMFHVSTLLPHSNHTQQVKIMFSHSNVFALNTTLLSHQSLEISFKPSRVL